MLMDWIDSIRWKLAEARELSYEEREDLIRDCYKLRYELYKLIKAHKNTWQSEWWRLVRENQPRPHCYEAFAAQKVNGEARKLTESRDCRLNVMVSGYNKDYVSVNMKTKRYPYEFIMRSDYDI